MGFCQGRGKVKTNICEYVEECNEKIECTTCDDIERGIYPVYIAGFGECKRDDRLSEKVGATMNREKEEMLDFYERVMIPQLKSQGNHFKSKIKEKECQIKEMQSHIECLKAELAEIQMNKQELPEEPIKVAEMLISTAGTYTNFLGKEEIYNVYDKSDLRQIAEHLLVYCNHAEVEE